MVKGICPKCNSIIAIDPSSTNLECPNCHEHILTESAVKSFNRTYNVLKRKAELNMVNMTDYEAAYKNYKQLFAMENTILNNLCGVILSCLYCSNMHKITIREATNALLKGSENVTISKDNVTILSDFLTKVREDSKMIVNAFAAHKEESNYALRMYETAVNEYIYYLDGYIQIFNNLDKYNVYLKEGLELLNEELSGAKKMLTKKVKVKNDTNEPHKFVGLDGKEIIDIFPNKKKAYKITLALLSVVGIGAILSITGLILATNKSIPNAVKYSVLGVGLVMFIGGYFLRHSIVDKNYKNK